MKKPHVLNRPMFNKGGTSAYGRGIASNLVTEEQRVRYNTGGRVGLQEGSSWKFSETGLGKTVLMGRGMKGLIMMFPPRMTKCEPNLKRIWKRTSNYVMQYLCFPAGMLWSLPLKIRV